MGISLNITATTNPVNFTLMYGYSTSSTDISTNLSTNKSKFKSSFSTQTLPAGSTAYIYVLCEITNIDLDASFVGTANWELSEPIQYSYAEIKTGKHIQSAIRGSVDPNNRPTYEPVTKSIIFGNLNDYADIVSGVTNPIDVSINNDGSVKVYRVTATNYVYILATQPNTKIKFNADSSYMFCPWDSYDGGYENDLTSIVFDNIDTSNVTNMSHMFQYRGGISTLDLSEWDTSSVTNMSSMFAQTSIDMVLLLGWDLKNLDDFSNMFLYAYIDTLDLSDWDTSNITDMSYMFANYGGDTLTLAGWDTSSVINMSYMFSDCTRLTSLDLSTWNTMNVTDMSSMFSYCTGLATLNLNGIWSVTRVTDASRMFQGCNSLTTLDLSSWSLSSIENTSCMFDYCTSLTKIYVRYSWNTYIAGNSDYMFRNCTKLVGGNGTTYNSNYTNKTYARVDASGTPGYFTLKQGEPSPF